MYLHQLLIRYKYALFYVSTIFQIERKMRSTMRKKISKEKEDLLKRSIPIQKIC